MASLAHPSLMVLLMIFREMLNRVWLILNPE